jgi:hypothetical protein
MTDSRRMDAARPSLGRRFKDVMFGDRRRDRRNNLAVLIWTAIWAVAYTATVQSITTGFAKGLLAWGLVALTALITMVALVAYVRFVREADEMIRRVHVNALAFGFAAGAVFSAANGIGVAMGRPAYGTNEMLSIMCLAFAGKLLWNLWRSK